MDSKCALMPPVICESGQPHIQHFSHQHPMPLFEIFFVEEVVCFACQSPCFGAPTYACEKCKYFLHKRCAECPSTEVTHSSHPSHSLCLFIDHEKRVRCKCCERKVRCNFILRCNTCDWSMCIECYLLPKNLNHEKYYFHSHHPDLTLSVCCTKFTCTLCHINFETCSCFKCTICDFVVDVECALMPLMTFEEQGCFRHFSHPHPMTLFDQKNDGDGVLNEYCFACNSPCTSGQTYYSCANCKYFLHKICADLPLKVNHPFHQHPNLTFLPPSKLGNIESFVCSLCLTKDYGFFFGCAKLDCKFKVCGRCIFVRPSIEHERHGQHPLCVVEKIHDLNFECGVYDGYCKLPSTSVELCTTESSVFRCVDCNFNVHLLCGPLPRTIKYDHHTHPLILLDSVIEDYSGKYYCDICESERDSRICVYYCQECHYIAHIHCLLSKVMSILKGDLRDVELKTVKIDIDLENKRRNKALTGNELEHPSTLKIFKDVIKSLPEDDQIMLWCHYDWDMSTHQPQLLGETGEMAWTRKLSRFTTEYFEKFIGWLNESCSDQKTLKLKFNNLLGSEIASIEGYMVPRILARVLVLLLRKHKDISSNSESSPEVKSLTYSFLCQVLHDMSKTSVRDVTKDDLKEWYFYLNNAQRRGFKVEFIFDHLKDVVRAFIGLQAAAERDDVRDVESIQANDILKLQNVRGGN